MMPGAKAERPSVSLGLTGSRREMLIGGAFALAAGTAFVRRPHRHIAYLGSGKLEALVPQRFAGWSFVTSSGLIMPPQDQLSNEVYNQILTRRYVNSTGAEVMLLIAYASTENGLVQIHRPEVCYPAGGFRLVRVEDHLTPLGQGISIPSRFIVADTPVRRESILYWTRLGRYFPRKWSEQRWAIFEQNLEGAISDGMLLRISSTDPAVEPAQLDEFAHALYLNVGNDMRRTLVGQQ